MVYAPKEYAGAMMVGRVLYVTNDLAIFAVMNMVNAKMARAFVHKAGMDDIALYVSILFFMICNCVLLWRKYLKLLKISTFYNMYINM